MTLTVQKVYILNDSNIEILNSRALKISASGRIFDCEVVFSEYKTLD